MNQAIKLGWIELDWVRLNPDWVWIRLLSQLDLATTRVELNQV